MSPHRSHRLASLTLASAIGSLPLFVGACGGDSGDPPARPNVLLISLDSVRRDFLSAYGYRSPYAPEELSSPNLDRLAGEGVLFEHAYATTSWTLPSHISILTGQPEVVHAVDIDYHRADPLRPTMAEILASNGYHTAGFFSGPYLEPHFGFARGFAVYESCYGEALSRAAANETAAAERWASANRKGDAAEIAAAAAEVEQATTELQLQSHMDQSSKFVADAVLAELEQAAATREPFFLFAHFFDPHYDFSPPEPFNTRFDPTYQGEIDGIGFIDDERIAITDERRPGGRIQTCGERDLAHLRALYAGELAWTDSQVGRILDYLAAHGLDQNTLVIVTSDHGDEFFEHGSLGHFLTLYEESVAIPLLLRLPGSLPAGQRVDTVVSTIDILPTVLELTGLPRPPQLVSRGLVPLLEGQDADAAERGVFGRIVRSFDMTLPVPPGEVEGDSIPGNLLRVTETFRKGPLKITRARQWTTWSAQLSPETEAHLQARFQMESEREFLHWIDVERHPDEPLALHSDDFSDPAVRSVLRDYHDRYEELLQKRRHADIQENDEYLDRLRALGYLDAGPEEPLPSNLFTLPPPGHDLLTAGRRGGKR